jgi:hypothetical protein
MPIRINLLAEHLEAEEMKRRDPIKRAVAIGALLLVLMLCWIGLTQMKVSAARAELTQNTNKLAKLEESTKIVKTNQALFLETDWKLNSLRKYATNRFYWGTFLDALQQVSVENIRLMDVRSEQRYFTNDAIKLLTTNITVPFTPPPAKWKFWASAGGAPDPLIVVSNQFKDITNRPPFTTNVVQMGVKVTPSETNLVHNQLITKVEFATVPFSVERITVEISGRDYGQPPGAAIDQFARQINNSSYFKQLLMKEGQGFRFTERPPQPRADPNDPINSEALFVPFTIECSFEERIFTNE